MGAGCSSKSNCRVEPMVEEHHCDRYCDVIWTEIPSHFNRWLEHTRASAENAHPIPLVIAGQSSAAVLRRHFMNEVETPLQVMPAAEEISPRGLTLDCVRIGDQLQYLFESQPDEFKLICRCFDAILEEPDRFRRSLWPYDYILHAHVGGKVILFEMDVLRQVEVLFFGHRHDLLVIPFPGAVVSASVARFPPSIHNHEWRLHDPVFQQI
eukprot:NODE_799_length_1897_cov_20.909632_g737_i0.p1 GENE.NODE_799_length_1897_cov_20.909632_g737_i0~~NODE_799_length_1897_cov_20.909632_g737_i0.p1  ORF type:complete len:210 (+),score=20.66 NODE_799_length_1897_cov_20.909632_g737_i0:87-716(+)